MVERRLAGAIILALSLTTAVAAEPPATALIGTPPQPGWFLLTDQQKSVLAPLSGQWESMDNIRRKKWLAVAARYPSLRQDEQRRIQERMREWASLTPEQRARARDTYKEFNQLPTEQKAIVKQKWEAYSSLPPEEQQRLRQSGKSAQLLAPPAATEAPTSAEPNK